MLFSLYSILDMFVDTIFIEFILFISHRSENICILSLAEIQIVLELYF